MLDRFRFVAQQRCCLEKSRLVLVGVSGGPDSTCLLHLLWRSGYRLVAAVFDHKLRIESRQEADSVRRLADALGIPCLEGEAQVREYAEEHGLSIEEAARNLRYRYLFQQADEVQAQAVAVGHTADDQVETALMHLLRGAGMAGLRGMSYYSLPNPWSKTIPLVRPMLSFWREEVQQYLHSEDLHPSSDPSNLDLTYFRNRLRHHLIPTLESYQPNFRRRLWQTAELLGADYHVLDELTNLAWDSCLAAQGDGYLAFKLQEWLRQPLAMQRYLLRRGCLVMRPSLRDIGYADVERGISWIAAARRTAQLDLLARLRLCIEGETIWLAAWEADLPALDWPQAPQGGVRLLYLPGRLSLAGDWELLVKPVASSLATQEAILVNQDPFQAWVDTERLQWPLAVRRRRPGDRFQPLGMGDHTVKLADFMVNVKMPRRARAGWPLVLSAGQILWVPGYRLAHPFRVRGESGEGIVHLMIRRNR